MDVALEQLARGVGELAADLDAAATVARRPVDLSEPFSMLSTSTPGKRPNRLWRIRAARVSSTDRWPKPMYCWKGE
jgi:hypothetical protein